MRKKITSFFILFLVFAGKHFSQNTDSLFAEREKIILQGVEYRNNLFHWNVAAILTTRLDLGFERKINLNLSWITGVNWNFHKDTSGINTYGGVRYYYNLEHRIMKRWKDGQQKTSCFSADYFEADLNIGWNYSKSFPYTDKLKRDYPSGILVGPTLKIGMQRLVGKHLFLDGWAGYKVIINNRGWLIAGVGIGLGI